MSSLTCACGFKRAVETLTKRVRHDHAGDESVCDSAHARGHEIPASMRLATETIQSILSLLPTQDFNAARHTCRLWLFASLERKLLEDMLRRAGWWSSMLRIIPPMAAGRAPTICQEQIMSKWIARESNLARCDESAFVQVGETDFRSLAGQCRSDDFGCDDFRLHGQVCFTVSLCGRYLIATLGQLAFLYELNHVCRHGQSAWAVPLRKRQGMPLGFMRPVAAIICPRRVLSCSMDTSSGRHSVAFLMEGRVGMVCDVGLTRDGRTGRTGRTGRAGRAEAASSMTGPLPSCRIPTQSSTAPDAHDSCVCHRRSPYEPPCTETGDRSVYRNICNADDPPRSVAICPQRNCVAFGCSAGIELH
ncbi:hypothetical protein E4U43_001149 [Claviceps pusilla]|uniref:F-box domain-containing protein n=1 Tax=Claviceps pusilla TaxID=123648 RepID=A0A9P7SYH7_9HYPO|nr:hypothetical protein E4U43_001149 [Claviceps pusilla]